MDTFRRLGTLPDTLLKLAFNEGTANEELLISTNEEGSWVVCASLRSFYLLQLDEVNGKFRLFLRVSGCRDENETITSISLTSGPGSDLVVMAGYSSGTLSFFNTVRLLRILVCALILGRKVISFSRGDYIPYHCALLS